MPDANQYRPDYVQKLEQLLVENGIQIPDHINPTGYPLFSLNRLGFQIRSQMNIVLGTLDLFRTTGTDSEQDDYLEMIETAAEKLLHTSNELSELSQISDPSFHLEINTFSPENQLKLVAESPLVQRLKDKSGAALELDIHERVPSSVEADLYVFTGVLQRLLTNAFKFAGNTSVHCSVDFTGDSLVVSVSDNGPGIDEETKSQLFSRLPVITDDVFETKQGVGLGLYISKALIDRADGRIEVESEPGRGAKFTFYLPAKLVMEEAEVQQAAGEDLGKLRILYAEDNADNRLIMERVIARTDWILEMAVDGQEAVEKFQTGNYDLLLFDVQMPRMDGMQAAREIRKIEKEKGSKSVPIIALTAQAMQYEKDECFAAGMNAHLAKPVRPAELRNAVLSVIKSDN